MPRERLVVSRLSLWTVHVVADRLARPRAPRRVCALVAALGGFALVVSAFAVDVLRRRGQASAARSCVSGRGLLGLAGVPR